MTFAAASTFRLLEDGQAIDLTGLNAISHIGPCLKASDVLGRLQTAARLKKPAVLGEKPDSADIPSEDFSITLLTSGTTGTPKAVTHSWDTLISAISTPTNSAQDRWLLTYAPAAFAGIQVILTAALSGATLVSAPGKTAAQLAHLLASQRISHASGTPSFWRTALTALPADTALEALRSVTLGGESADQSLLDALQDRVPNAILRHIYATTEFGVIFSVRDGRAGFPADWLQTGVNGWQLQIEDDVLQLRRSPDQDWASTGDLIHVNGSRAFFAGRIDHRANVGGVKVDPLQIEDRLTSQPGITDAAVDVHASPITGALLTARIVAAPKADTAAIRELIKEALSPLPAAAQPRRIEFVKEIPVSANGKKIRKRLERSHG